jgi:hypothetical protein
MISSAISNNRRTKLCCFIAVLSALFQLSLGFQLTPRKNTLRQSPLLLKMTETSPQDPQVLASGYSEAMKLGDAIQEAMDMALQALPKATSPDSKIDLAIVSTSSLYDGTSSPSDVVPAILSAARNYGQGIQTLVGSSSGGFVSSRPNLEARKDENGMLRSFFPIEREGVPGVSVMLCILPEVTVKVGFLENWKLNVFTDTSTHFF